MLNQFPSSMDRPVEDSDFTLLSRHRIDFGIAIIIFYRYMSLHVLSMLLKEQI